MREENDQKNLGNGNDTDISQKPASGHQSNTNSKAAAGLGEAARLRRLTNRHITGRRNQNKA